MYAGVGWFAACSLPSVCLWAWVVVVTLCHALHGHVIVVDVVVGGVAIV